MPLSNLPGPWRWERRNGFWWRVHQTQGIEDGPHTWDELNFRMGGFGEHGSTWYDRQGEPIPVRVAEEYLSDYDYKVVAKDVVIVRGEPVEVSTVWLGLDHNFWSLSPDHPIKIFETMIFDHDGYWDYQRRYSTEEEARQGHADAIKLVQLKEQARDQ
jgi:hypothetical protein